MLQDTTLDPVLRSRSSLVAALQEHTSILACPSGHSTLAPNYFVSTACVASPSEGACMDWLNEAWRFLESEENQKALAFVGGRDRGRRGCRAGRSIRISHRPAPPSNPLRPSRPAGAAWLARRYHISRRPHRAPSSSAVCTVFHRRTFKRSRPSSGSPRPRWRVSSRSWRSRRSPPRTSTAPSATSPSASSSSRTTSSATPPMIREVAALRARARAVLEAGEFDRAEQLLNEASANDLAAAERQESVARQRRLSAARSKANNGDLKWTQFAYREAAEYYRQAAALVPAEAEAQRAEYLNLQGRALYDAGDYRDAEAPLTQARRPPGAGPRPRASRRGPKPQQPGRAL